MGAELHFTKREDRQLTDELYSVVPEFKDFVSKILHPDFHQNCYFVFESLGEFLIGLTKGDTSSPVASVIVNHINRLCDRKSEKIDTVLRVTFFEYLIGHKSVVAFGKEGLKGRALTIFEQVSNSPMFRGL